jgi:6-phospho-beta-glucosidase
MRKVTIIGGGGVRTPLLIHGMAQARQTLGAGELRLYDPDGAHAEIIARLGAEIVRRLQHPGRALSREGRGRRRHRAQ